MQSLKWDPNLENMAIYVDIGTSLIAFMVIAGVDVFNKQMKLPLSLGSKKILKHFYKEG